MIVIPSVSSPPVASPPVASPSARGTVPGTAAAPESANVPHSCD